MWYSHIEKFLLGYMHAIQSNPMQHILTQWIIKAKYSKWIVILQEFYLEFVASKSNMSLVFAEAMFELPKDNKDIVFYESLVNETLLLIASSKPWYGSNLVAPFSSIAWWTSMDSLSIQELSYCYKHFMSLRNPFNQCVIV